MRYDIVCVKSRCLDSRRRPGSGDALDAESSGHYIPQDINSEITHPSRGAIVSARGRCPTPHGALRVPYLGRVDGLRAAGIVVRRFGLRAVDRVCHNSLICQSRHWTHCNDGCIEAKRRRVEDKHGHDGCCLCARPRTREQDRQSSLSEWYPCYHDEEFSEGNLSDSWAVC